VIGVQKLVDTYWIRFIDMDIECICRDKYGCPQECSKDCKEYIVKLTEIKRETFQSPVKELEQLEKEMKRTTTELKKSLNKLKGFKI
jgi:hypothetical protein